MRMYLHTAAQAQHMDVKISCYQSHGFVIKPQLVNGAACNYLTDAFAQTWRTFFKKDQNSAVIKTTCDLISADVN